MNQSMKRRPSPGLVTAAGGGAGAGAGTGGGAWLVQKAPGGCVAEAGYFPTSTRKRGLIRSATGTETSGYWYFLMPA